MSEREFWPGWRVVFFGPLHNNNLGPLDTWKEAMDSALICYREDTDLRTPIVYYGERREFERPARTLSYM